MYVEVCQLDGNVVGGEEGDDDFRGPTLSVACVFVDDVTVDRTA